MRRRSRRRWSAAILLANGGWIEGDLVDVRVPAIEARTAQPQARRARAERSAAHPRRRPSSGRHHRGNRRKCTDGAWLRTRPAAGESARSEDGLVARHAAQLASRSGARNRPHRRGRARLRLQPLRQHAARFWRGRARAALGRERIRGPQHAARRRFPRSDRQHILLRRRGRADRAAARAGRSARQPAQRRGRRAAPVARAGHAGA